MPKDQGAILAIAKVEIVIEGIEETAAMIAAEIGEVTNGAVEIATEAAIAVATLIRPKC
ncbi:MAG: hypothetical protein ACIALR_01140 [Blastopirellula sp. JB062]